MTIYTRFEPPVINPRNSGDIIAGAVSSVYRLTAGNLRNFLPGSPLMVIIEALCFTYLELAHWTENLPDAYAVTLLSRFLGQGQNVGSYSQAVLSVDLSYPLATEFTIPAGAVVLSNSNDAIKYIFDADLVIPAGSVNGSITVTAEALGPSTAVQANELTVLARNFAYVSAVTNISASTIGQNPETPAEAQDRIKALFGARNPSSEADWQVLVQEAFGLGTVSRVVNNRPGLGIYIKNLTSGPALTALQSRANLERNLFQEVFIQPFDRVGLDLAIRYTDSTPVGSECIRIAQELNFFIEEFLGAPQPIDIYEEFVRITDNRNLVGFEVRAYELGVRFYNRVLEPYDFALGQIVLDSAGQYYQSTADTNIAASPFDEAELGLLQYYPVLESFQGGFVESGYIVQNSGTYYVVNASGSFQPGINAIALPASVTWAFGQPYDPTDFIYAPGISPELSHGFIPVAAYTSAADGLLNLTAITPTLKAIGDPVASGEVWSLASQPALVYIATSPATVDQTYLQSLTAETIVPYPQPKAIDHWLKHHSRYRIGTLDITKNYVYVTAGGDQKAVPAGVDTDLLPSANQPYGTLFLEGAEVWEFKAGALPVAGDSSLNLPVAKATRPVEDFSFITYPEQIPYFLKVSTVSFIRGFANDPEKTVIESTPGNYILQ